MLSLIKNPAVSKSARLSIISCPSALKKPDRRLPKAISLSEKTWETVSCTSNTGTTRISALA